MEHVDVSRDGEVVVATLNRGKANAIVPAMVEELHEVLDRVRTDASVSALVLSSANPRMFSAGFDLAEVFSFDNDRMREFFGRFMDLFEGLRLVQKPTVAAVTGHAFAGGALLAIACDFRVMADGESGFAINEVNLGLVLPDSAVDWLVDALGPAARRVLLGGQALVPAQAMAAGIAHEVVPPAEVVPRAVALAHELGGKPPHAYAAVKRSLGRAYGQPMTPAGRGEAISQFMAFWEGAESRKARAEAIAKVTKKMSRADAGVLD